MVILRAAPVLSNWATDGAAINQTLQQHFVHNRAASSSLSGAH